MAATMQQIYDATLDAIYQLTVNGASSVSLNGKTWTAQNLGELQKLNDWAKTRIDATNSNNRMTIGVVEFGPVANDGCRRTRCCE